MHCPVVDHVSKSSTLLQTVKDFVVSSFCHDVDCMLLLVDNRIWVQAQFGEGSRYQYHSWTPPKGRPCHKVLFICLSFYLFICLSVYLFIFLSVYLQRTTGAVRNYGVRGGRDNLLCRILALWNAVPVQCHLPCRRLTRAPSHFTSTRLLLSMSLYFHIIHSNSLDLLHHS